MTDPTATNKASCEEAAVQVNEGSFLIALKRAATSVQNAESPLATVSLQVDSKFFLFREVRTELYFLWGIPFHMSG